MLDPESGSTRITGPTLSRRRVLVDGGRGLLALALVGPAATACGPSKPPEPDPLEAELLAARRDSALATAAAKSAPRSAVPALSEIAALRTRHAGALVEELARAAGKPTPTETTESAAATSPAAPPSDKPEPPPAVRDVAEALTKSAESAAKLVPSLSGYRAGLMGSIAAACTAAYTVGLPTPAPRKPGSESTVSHLPEGRLPGPGPATPSTGAVSPTPERKPG